MLYAVPSHKKSFGIATHEHLQQARRAHVLLDIICIPLYFVEA